jgi:hypothetical protein
MDINKSILPYSYISIKHIGGGPGHPIYLVETVQGNFILKCEKTPHRSYVQYAAETIAIVDPTAKSRTLDEEEIKDLYQWVLNPINKVDDDHCDLPSLLKIIEDPINHSPKPSFAFSIIESKTNMKNFGDAKDQWDKLGRKGGKDLSRKIADILNAPMGLEKLGKIIAADAFNGNTDRIDFTGTGVPKPGGFKCLANVGNFFIVDEPTGPTINGLDYYDPNNCFKDIFRNLREKSSECTIYPGSILHPENDKILEKKLKDLIDDFDEILAPRNRNFIGLSKSRLPSNALSRLKSGVRNGAREISNFLGDKYFRARNQDPRIENLKIRCNACGFYIGLSKSFRVERGWKLFY